MKGATATGDNSKRFFTILGTSALWGAVVVPIIATSVLLGRGIGFQGFGALLPWVLLFIGVPSVLLSIIGGVWLGTVAQTCESSVRLLMNGAATVPFSLFALVADRTGTGSSGFFFLLSAGIGAITGLGYSAVFRSVLRPATKY